MDRSKHPSLASGLGLPISEFLKWKLTSEPPRGSVKTGLAPVPRVLESTGLGQRLTLTFTHPS